MGRVAEGDQHRLQQSCSSFGAMIIGWLSIGEILLILEMLSHKLHRGLALRRRRRDIGTVAEKQLEGDTIARSVVVKTTQEW